MDLSSWPSANLSDAKWHREDFQRRQGGKDAVLWAAQRRTLHQILAEVDGQTGWVSVAAFPCHCLGLSSGDPWAPAPMWASPVHFISVNSAAWATRTPPSETFRCACWWPVAPALAVIVTRTIVEAPAGNNTVGELTL